MDGGTRWLNSFSNARSCGQEGLACLDVRGRGVFPVFPGGPSTHLGRGVGGQKRLELGVPLGEKIVPLGWYG